MLVRDVHLRFVSISHRTSPVGCRERFYVADGDKQALLDCIQKQFPEVSSLMLLVTCNRTEIYFESRSISASQIRDVFLKFALGLTEGKEQPLFITGDKTEGTVKHLLRVAAGLESSVLGDAEILHQVKKAYHFALERGLQGTLLERAVQTVFRSHKRISNETAFRDGTTSTAYKALKLTRDVFGGEAHEKNILFVGAGDIVEQLFKYNTKFGYRNVWITNRTEAKSKSLAKRYKARTLPWNTLVNNQLQDFDVIITAVSNCSSLISGGLNPDRELLLVDLAVPGNIDPRLQEQPNVLFSDLDNIASHLEENRATRLEAAVKVECIIKEEWRTFLQWYRQQPFRELLAQRKTETLKFLEENPKSAQCEPKELAKIADQVVRKLLKEPGALSDSAAVKEMVDRVLPFESV
ncbi:MAG: glutamyl-tRNA reductase [Eudoraea sp.]|nr:glutamyl-tRNA reductase [Eudoraea sp.]